MVLDKNVFGYLSLVFVVVSSGAYIVSTLKGKTRPHIFTWILWCLLSAIAAAAQYAGNAGPGAWSAGLAAVFCLLIALLAFSHGDKTITPFDWMAFILGLSAIPLWYFTSNPFWAAALATFVDVVGYLPTFRKSYSKPREEMVFSYLISNLKHAASILAIVEYSATTLIYPAVLLGANTALISMLLWRRHSLKIPA